MPGRSYIGNSYRYGYNGNEKDDEIKGEGNSIDFGERMSDSRLGRWISVDKKFKNSPYVTPYNYGANNPIIYVDPDGNTEFYFNGKWIASDGVNNGLIGIVTDRNIKKDIVKNNNFPFNVESGKAFNGGFGLHKEVLKEANNVLNRAFEASQKGTLQEQTAVMKENKSGGYDVTNTGVGGNTSKSDEKASATIPQGDVSIHSHLVDAWINKDGAPEYFDAEKPSPSRVDGSGGDRQTFENYCTNIIVGKNGTPIVNAEFGKTAFGQLDYGQINRTMKDGREPSINIFNTKSEKVGTISQGEAKSILKNEEKPKK